MSYDIVKYTMKTIEKCRYMQYNIHIDAWKIYLMEVKYKVFDYAEISVKEKS